MAIASSDALIKLNQLETTITELNKTIPTKTSDLENDKNYQTQTQVKSAIAAAISGGGGEVGISGIGTISVKYSNYQNVASITCERNDVLLQDAPNDTGTTVFSVNRYGNWKVTMTMLDEKVIVKGIAVSPEHPDIGINMDGSLFAFHYSENDPNPDSVTYPAGYDNSNWEDPFYVDLSTGTPHYGDWDPNGEHADQVRFLFPRSCMLKYDGTVDYYLDENDETKREDGITPSDITDNNYGGNAMMEWAQDGCTIYWKVVPDKDNMGFTFVVGNYRADTDMKPWNHYNCKDEVSDHWYTPKYFGSSDGTRLRSLSGKSNYVNTTTDDERIKARANNVNGLDEWDILYWVDWEFWGFLCCLMAKSLRSQEKYGYGRCKSGITSAIATGTMNGKGMFYGRSDQTSGVKVFGMENMWGNVWQRAVGCINDKGTMKVKLTHGTQDGSTVNGYNTTGEGYVPQGTIGGTSGGYIKNMHITPLGLTPKNISGSSSTYYCDGGWFNNSQVNVALCGGGWYSALLVGVWCVSLDDASSNVNTAVGAAPFSKPVRKGESDEV